MCLIAQGTTRSFRDVPLLPDSRHFLSKDVRGADVAPAWYKGAVGSMNRILVAGWGNVLTIDEVTVVLSAAAR